jgi:hypothetical protein
MRPTRVVADTLADAAVDGAAGNSHWTGGRA